MPNKLKELHDAIENNNEGAVILAISEGANVNKQYCNSYSLEWAFLYRYTPIIEATRSNNIRIIPTEEPQIIRILLGNKADIKKINGHYGQESFIKKAIYFRDSAAVELLLNYGASATEKYDNGNNLIHDLLSSLQSQPKEEDAIAEIITLLLRHGVNPNEKNGIKLSALHLALENERYKAAEILLKHGANIEETDQSDYTHLCNAISNKKVKAVAFLLQHRANPNVKLYIKDSKTKKIVGSLTPLTMACGFNCSYEIVQLLLAHGASLTGESGDGISALHKTARDDKNTVVIDLLIVRGALINAPRKDLGLTALHFAAMSGNDVMVKHLLKCGADLHARNNKGQTAGDLAKENKFTNLAHQLSKWENNPKLLQADFANSNGLMMFNKKDYQEALIYFQQAVNFDPQNKTYLLNKGHVLYLSGRAHDAIDSIKQALKMDATDAQAWNHKGNAYSAMGKYNKARDSYEQALKLQGNNAVFLGNHAGALLSLECFDEAINYFNKSLAIDQNYAYSKENKEKALALYAASLDAQGKTYCSNQDYSEALERFTKAVSLVPNNKEYLTNKGLALRESNRHDEAISTISEAIKIDITYANAWYEKGKTFSAQKRYDKALECFLEAIRLQPENFEYMTYSGVALLEQEQFDRSEECFKKLLKKDSNYQPAKENLQKVSVARATFWNKKGNIFLAEKKYSNAIDCFNEALNIDPKNKHYYNNKGLALSEIVCFEEAIECFNNALEIDHTYITAIYNRKKTIAKMAVYLNDKGNTCLSEGNHVEALKLFATVCSFEPENTVYLNNKATALKELERYDEAIECFDEVLKKDGKNSFAAENRKVTLIAQAKYYNKKGERLFGNSEYNEALHCYQKAIEINPDKKYLLNYAATLIKLVQYDEALRTVNRVMELTANDQRDPDFADAYFYQAIARRGLKDFVGAMRDLEKALSLKKNYYPEATKELETTKMLLQQEKDQQLQADRMRREQEEQERKRKHDQERIINFERQLNELSLSLCNVDQQQLSEINKRFKELQSEAAILKHVGFYVVRGNFYVSAANNDKNSTRKQVLYNNALQDLKLALTYDPFVENIPERIEKIQEELIKMALPQPGLFFAEGSADKLSNASMLPKREDLTPEQIQTLELMKAKLRQDRMGMSKKN